MYQADFNEVPNNADFVRAFQYQGVDLTGSALSMMVYDAQNPAVVFLKVDTTSGGITITDAVNGKFQIALPLGKLSSMPLAKSYAQDLVRTLPGGSTDRLWRGAFVLKAGPART